MKKPTFRLLCLVLAFWLPACGFVKSNKTPKNLYLNSEPSYTQKRYYKEISRVRSETIFERNKIRCLLEALRLSPLTFIRNGVPYTGIEAAQHLGYKYSKTMTQVKTARYFIDHLAAFSSISGKPYLVKLPNGKTYPARDLFYNELKRLEDSIQNSQVQ